MTAGSGSSTVAFPHADGTTTASATLATRGRPSSRGDRNPTPARPYLSRVACGIPRSATERRADGGREDHRARGELDGELGRGGPGRAQRRAADAPPHQGG